MSAVMELITVHRNYIIIGLIALVCFYVAYNFFMGDRTPTSIELMESQINPSESIEESLKAINILPENITEEIEEDEGQCNESVCVRNS